MYVYIHNSTPMLGAPLEKSVLPCKCQDTVGGNLPGRPGTSVPDLTLEVSPTKTQTMEALLGLGKMFREVQTRQN